MKVFAYDTYGTPEVLQLDEIEIPKPKDTEILVQTRALSINPSEWHKLTASFWLLRLSSGLLKPKNRILGADVAGQVVSVGKNVTQFKKGDRVFGRNPLGSLAEYCCIGKSAVAFIPGHMSDAHAAALPLAMVTALIALRDKGQIKANQKVLINGASGGIGTFAVQLAKNFKTHVTGVCSTDNINLVKSIGADTVIDYKREDLKSYGSRYDLIIDLVGNEKVKTLKKLLNPHGRCVLVGMDAPKRLFSNMFFGMIYSIWGDQKVIPMDTQVTSEDLTLVSKLVAKNKVRPVIANTYDFKSIPEAFTQLGTKRSKGKIVIKL